MEVIRVRKAIDRDYLYLKISVGLQDYSNMLFSQQSYCPVCYLDGQFMKFDDNWPIMYCPRCKMSWKVDLKEN